jgi:hypothetical protein
MASFRLGIVNAHVRMTQTLVRCFCVGDYREKSEGERGIVQSINLPINIWLYPGILCVSLYQQQ